MIQIEPNQKFPLTWNVPDPNDSTTYYVRAYIYEFDSAGTRTELDTQNLTDNGDLTFFYNYQFPVDSSGQGRPLIVVYKAFTDSGYTTEQTTYANRFTETYLIKETWGSHRQVGGPSAAVIREIVEDVVKNRKQQKIPKTKKQKETDLSPVIDSIKRIKFPEIPEHKETDLSPVYRWLGRLEMKMEEFAKRPQFKETDLKPVIKEIQGAEFSKLREMLTDDSRTNKEVTTKMLKRVDGLAKDVEDRAYIEIKQPKKEDKNKDRRRFY